jgi:hypothetical protein|tara:strand:- start:7168 stop:7347 length:180 start_codon:yes stop_codon:yes gene_type:complete
MKGHKFNFDKFVNDINEREGAGRQRVIDHADKQESLPQRRYNRLYREHWQNSTRFKSKK